MKVRNRLLKATEYKGKMTDACDRDCPCRPCWHPHDCGRLVPVYKNGIHSTSNWEENFQCATRYNNGCPDQDRPARHVRPKNGHHYCARCGAHVPDWKAVDYIDVADADRRG